MISSDVATFSGQFGVLILCLLTAVVLVVATRRQLGYLRYRGGPEQLDIAGTR